MTGVPALTGDNGWIVDAWVGRRRRQILALTITLEEHGFVPAREIDLLRAVRELPDEQMARLVRHPALGWWNKQAMAGLAANQVSPTTFASLRRLAWPPSGAARHELLPGVAIDVTEPTYGEVLADTAAMQDELREDRSQPIALVSDASAAHRDFLDAAALLRAASPSDLDDVAAFTRAVVPFQGSGMDSFSRNDCPGALFVNWRPGDRFWNVEHLVHENAHGRLNAIQEVTPLWLNPPEARYPSPWRRDPRPIEGIFQATYVFYLAVALFRRLVAYSPEAEPRLRPYLIEQVDNLTQGRGVLREHAQLSEVGQAFFAQLEAGIDAVEFAVR